MKISSEDAYPLKWPDGVPRTRRRDEARFKVSSFVRVRDELLHELKLLGARYVVLSANIPLRLDGLPYANTRMPDDPGVAVYFDYDGSQKVFACDRWRRVEHNLRAIQKTVEAFRGIERWGAGDMLKRAVNAFEALPAPSEGWRAVFDIRGSVSLEDVRSQYRKMAATAHPDTGGSVEAMQRLNEAMAQARIELAGITEV